MKLKIDLRTGKALLSGPKLSSSLHLLRSLEGRRTWLEGCKYMALEPTTHNIERLTSIWPDLIIVREAPVATRKPPAPTPRPPYRSKTEAYPHQEEALQKALGKDAFALFAEQGTGKTKIAIDIAGHRWAANEIDAVIVVSKRGVHRQWIVSQLETHCGSPHWAGAFWDGSKFLPVKSGTGLAWYAINFDGLKTSRGMKACLGLAERFKRRILIIADETQEIKNPNSDRHKAMVALKAAVASRYRLALTGTPIAKDLTDEWAQLRWLDEAIIGIRYVGSFRNEYCIMGGHLNKQVVAHKNLERFKERVAPYSFRARKDGLVLPKSYRQWRFELSAEQQRILASLKSLLIAQIDSGEIVSAATAISAMMRIQQVTNGFVVDETDQLHWLPANPRLEALIDVLGAYPGKTIVWTRFRADIKAITQRFLEGGITYVEYHGATNDKQRAAAIKAFLEDDDPRVFISQPQAGGTGLNLQGECSHAIYYANSFSAIDRWQSEDRIHRIGTKGSVVYTDLIAQKGMDGKILQNLRIKKDLQAFALGDIKELLSDEAE